ncbi:redoxin domain-containing protein [Oligoflexus tunisiensis]|uniref:redoxin domain-containing protein n=1 Tax=Oligoflexus tunisiensis TaxID=708132 RepID=UPI00114C9A2F|nr:redoxin domain-containing protein [Oligoflexus tunisiensis]
MKTTLLTASLVLFGATALAAPQVGKPAPQFSVLGSDGKTHKLADYKGKWVVLEWWNPDCPFVQRHYDTGNMPNVQKYAKSKGKDNLVWFAVNTAGPSVKEKMSADDANKLMAKSGAAVTTVFLDHKAELGHMYEAKTTPQMFVINPEGNLVYMGAIDSIPRPKDPKETGKAINYVRLALDSAMAGQPVKTTSTQPYGCSVKY